MKEFFRTFLAVVAAEIFLGLGIFLAVAGFAAVATSKGVDVPRGAYLIQRISGEIREYAPPQAFPRLGSGPPTLTRIMENLEKARSDDRIRGVVLEVGGSDLGMAKREEIRERIRQLRDAGKPVYAFCRAIGPTDYYMIAGCDSIIVPPEGILELRGLAAELPFFKGTLEALGIKPNVDRIAEYKTAAEVVTRNDLSDESRANLRWILRDLFDEMVAGIAEDRGLSRDQVLGFMDEAMHTARAAKEEGLVDLVAFWEDLETRLSGDDPWKTISGADYAKVTRKSLGLAGRKKIAIVHAQGVIAGGENGYTFPFGLKMGSETMTEVLDDVRKDDSIDGVVFRVDSPGGESLASDEISYAVSLLGREKPTVVSMVDVAGSGGYMIAYRCSTIVALPATITGSIGSITGKFNMHGLYKRLGINKDYVTVGPRARMNSDDRDYSREEWRIVRSRHLEGYEQWVRQVAEMRGLELAAMDTLAGGREWTGRQAVDRRLADRLGGLDAALALVKEKAGIPAGEKVAVVHYPKPKSFFERLVESGPLAPAWARPLMRGALRILARLGPAGDRGEPELWGAEPEVLDPSLLDAVWLWRIG